MIALQPLPFRRGEALHHPPVHLHQDLPAGFHRFLPLGGDGDPLAPLVGGVGALLHKAQPLQGLEGHGDGRRGDQQHLGQGPLGGYLAVLLPALQEHHQQRRAQGLYPPLRQSRLHRRPVGLEKGVEKEIRRVRVVFHGFHFFR